MHRAHRRSLTEGSIFLGMGAFFLPLLAGQIVSIVGSAVNTFILGKVIGSDALAAEFSAASGYPGRRRQQRRAACRHWTRCTSAAERRVFCPPE